MNKLNNLKTREEFLNEGVVKDFVKPFAKKIQNAFRIMVGKIKDFIAVYDSNGNILPVTTLQAVADHFKGNKNIKVYGSKSLNSDIKKLGGSGCETNALEDDSNEVDDETPDGALNYVNWIENDYKETNFYHNLATLQERLAAKNESLKLVYDNELNEEVSEKEWSGKRDRVSYLSQNEKSMALTKSMSYEDFAEAINDRIENFCGRDEKIQKLRDEYGDDDVQTLFVLGAPGIGKSTIPNRLVREFNKGKESYESITLISINCANIQSGDLLMPALPKEVDIASVLNDSPESFDGYTEETKDMSDEEKKEMINALKNVGLTHANSAPQPWLPCYKKTKSEKLNRICDSYANGGLLSKTNAQGRENTRTGSGGIIMLDEFLRAPRDVFSELMNLLLDRTIGDGYVLGSRWFFVACSNRPCDDEKTKEGFNVTNGPTLDRHPQIFHLDPDPDEWKEFARRKGFDETLLKFIFDKSEDSLVNDEYTRWHRVADNEHAKKFLIKPVTPRNWMRVHVALVKYCYKHNLIKEGEGFSINCMTIDQIKKVIGGYFSTDFEDELINWLNEYCNDLDLDMIIEHPEKAIKPYGKEAEVIVENLLNRVEQKYGMRSKYKGKVPDSDLKNIMIWLGINFREDYNVVMTNFACAFDLKLSGDDKKEHKTFMRHTETVITMFAAWPTDDIQDFVENIWGDVLNGNKNKHQYDFSELQNGNEFSDFTVTDTNDYLNKIEEKAKKYFPWRIRNGKLIKDIFKDDGSATDEDKAKAADWTDKNTEN